ncbi:hypothetical protein MOXK23_16180 [Moraxella sp. K23]
MKKLGVAMVAVMMTSTAIGANWVNLGETDNKEFIHSLDFDSVRKLNTYSKQISYFTKTDFSKAQKTTDGKYYNYEKVQWKGDCENNRTSLMGAIGYTKNGSAVYSYNIPYDNWQPAFPDTVAEIRLKIACYLAGYRDTL